MVYLGRVICAGLTPSGYPFAAYAISGRSPFSKKRRFDLFPEDGRLFVGPLGEPTDDQKRLADLLFYNAMRTRDDFLFVTNGAQTDVPAVGDKPMPNFFHNYRNGDSHIPADEIVFHWGYETDSPIFTPRTALAARGGENRASFSIAAKQSDEDAATKTAFVRAAMTPSTAKYLATYKGIGNEAASWRGVDIVANPRLIGEARIVGETPDEIAHSMYRFLDPAFIVAAAGAVWDGQRWQFADPINKFKDEVEFNAYVEANK